VARLVQETGEAGLATSLAVNGDRPAVVAPAVDLCGYRIVQEALTNAVKYAGRSRATVSVCWGATEVTVEVRDDGRGEAGTPGRAGREGGGHGLAGMRERVALLGGELSAGPCAGGGFRVAARLPYTSALTRE
jgi:signal transduction histidine kinase